MLLEGHTPLVAQGASSLQRPRYRFKTSDRVALYTEIYEPHEKDKTPPILGIQIRLLTARRRR